MTYEKLKELKRSEFKRRCGVHPETFEKMVNILKPVRLSSRKARRTEQVKCSRSITAHLRILERISHTVSHRTNMGSQ